MLNEKHRFYGKTKLIELEKFKNIFNSQKFEYVDAILLFGSRAIGTFHERSDYDFAVLLKRDKVNAWGEMSRIWVDIGHNF
ncbi:MAG: nucleotidyltransferase domain-containing protein, partial [Campylobacterota bacterium]|nr:nucleotidyltransferase domain-containing protein [Campylobacterota bacterium]